jgi:hypothetical protein
MGNATDAAVCRPRGLARLGRLLARDRTDIGTALTSRLGACSRPRTASVGLSPPTDGQMAPP